MSPSLSTFARPSVLADKMMPLHQPKPSQVAYRSCRATWLESTGWGRTDGRTSYVALSVAETTWLYTTLALTLVDTNILNSEAQNTVKNYS